MSKLGKVRIAGAIILFLLAGAMATIGFSRYMTQLEGTGTISVATWSFKAGFGEDELSGETLSAIRLTPSGSYSEMMPNRVAPGTSGSFDIVVDGTGSQVALDVNVALYRDQNTVLPAHLVLYQASAQDPSQPDKSRPVLVSQKESAEEALQDAALQFEIPYSATAGQMKKTFTIFWEWPYESANGDDAAYDLQDQLDANSGMNSAFGFQVVIRGVQRSPLA